MSYLNTLYGMNHFEAGSLIGPVSMKILPERKTNINYVMYVDLIIIN